MSGLIESYKKVYENKQAHIWLLVISIIWTLLSALWDIKTGNFDNYRQNPLDIVFNIIIGAYSLQFLHNAMKNINNGVLPPFTKICPKIFLGVIKLNIIWGIYAVLILISAILLYIATHFIVIPVVITVFLFFIAVFVYYIFIAYAEELNSKGLANAALLFKFIKPGFKPLYLKLLLFILFSISVAVIYILLYIAAGLIGLDKIGHIAGDFYFMDIIMNTLAGYFVIVTWYFAFPYSLISSYFKNIRPLIRKDENNDGNA